MSEQADPDIDALIGAFYAAFDNRGGRAPDEQGLRAMFAETATITRLSAGQVERWTPQAFIAPRVAMLSDGTLTDFHEWETEARTLVRGAIACRWSRYEKQGLLSGADYRGGGNKFLQVFKTDGRWRISAILWEDDPAEGAAGRHRDG